MDLFAAVDVLAGRSVRLVQGDFASVRDYGDPVSTARALVSSGAPWLHVVDLDAARGRVDAPTPIVKRILAEAGGRAQVGGGIRDERRAEEVLDAGAERVVLSTAALADPGLVERLATRFPGRVVVGLDHRGPPAFTLAVRGWSEETESLPGVSAAAARFEAAGAAALVVTAIPTDGTLAGPDIDGLCAVLGATSTIPVVASGGIGTLEDLDVLLDLEVGSRRLAGVVVGRALREGRFRVEEALARCAASG